MTGALLPNQFSGFAFCRQFDSPPRVFLGVLSGLGVKVVWQFGLEFLFAHDALGEDRLVGDQIIAIVRVSLGEHFADAVDFTLGANDDDPLGQAAWLHDA